MADKKEQSALEQFKLELAKERAKNAQLQDQMKRSGISVPKSIEGVHTYSGKEENFKDKKYNFKLGHLRIRITPHSLGLSKDEAAKLYNHKGFLVAEKAIKNAKVMNTLIERGAGVIEEIKIKEATEEATEEAAE